MDVTVIPARPPFTIRPATAGDYERLVALWTAAGVKLQTGGRERKSAFLRQIEQFADLYLVAGDGDELVGVVLGTHDGRKGWISRLAVHPGYQRRGVGAALVSACDAAIRAQGIEIVCALVETGNAASAALFEKLGFRADVPVLYYRKPRHPGA